MQLLTVNILWELILELCCWGTSLLQQYCDTQNSCLLEPCEARTACVFFPLETRDSVVENLLPAHMTLVPGSSSSLFLCGTSTLTIKNALF